MPPSRLVAQLTFPEPGTKGQQLYGNGWSAGDRGRGGVEVGGGGLVVLPLPARPLASGAGVCQALRTSAPGSLPPRPGPPPGPRQAEAPLQPAPQRTDTPGPGFMNEIQPCGYK